MGLMGQVLMKQDNDAIDYQKNDKIFWFSFLLLKKKDCMMEKSKKEKMSNSFVCFDEIKHGKKEKNGGKNMESKKKNDQSIINYYFPFIEIDFEIESKTFQKK